MERVHMAGIWKTEWFTNRVELRRITNDIGEQKNGHTSPPRTVASHNVTRLGNRIWWIEIENIVETNR